MLLTSIILFAFAAIVGVTILFPLLTGKPVSRSLAVLHGIFAASALILLIIFSFNHSGDYPLTSIILFTIAAIGGLFLFVRDLNSKPGPKGLAFVHAAVAVISFLILLVFTFSI
jgi:hypothetical protein